MIADDRTYKRAAIAKHWSFR